MTQAECEALLSADMDHGPDPTLYSTDETAARACLAKVAAAACGELFDPALDADCRAATVGSLTAGSCCDGRGGCGPGLRCSNVDGGPGSCVPASAIGGGCNDHHDCEPGLFCDDATDSCAPLVQSGGDCTQDDECAHAVCNNGTCGPSALNGESCAAVDCFEMSWLWCDSGTCAPLPSLGGDCSASDACAGGSYCDGSTCAALGGLGDGCAAGVECEPGLYCDYTSAGGHTCKTLLGEGETCNPNLSGEDCDSGLGLGCNDDTHTCEPSSAMCQ